QVRTALDLLQSEQAVILLQPDARTLKVMLHCEDFSSDIRSHRLWFVSGERWTESLSELLQKNPGLPAPAQFIRPILANSAPADGLIGPAQKVFAEVNAARVREIQQIVSGWKPRAEKCGALCVIAASRFRLWDDAPFALWNSVTAPSSVRRVDVRRFDPDRVNGASSLTLARLASESDAVVSANLARGDIPGAVPIDMPWVTWITRPPIPNACDAGPRDRLVLADAAWEPMARQAGWSPERIRIAEWPGICANESMAGEWVSLIADTLPLRMPDRVREYSSHGLLWEMIEQELLADPFEIGADLEAYLDDRMKRLQIAENGFDRAMFVKRLIVPAFQQGVASVLKTTGVPLRLLGRGWDQLEPFASFSAGPVVSREQFERAVADSRVLVHAWPSQFAHPIDACGRRVVRAFGQGRATFIAGVEDALDLGTCEAASGASRLSLDQLLSLL
ncbi:MAG TPA: hypothetical protein VN541_18770, partial [Tepidisphaeraceae bacterium]|nr:hypothetical protein [Tepidisphaeraceae bacterium]